MIVSEIGYNQAVERLRFDAEFYKPEYLETEEIVKKFPYTKTLREFVPIGIPYLRVGDMKGIFLDIDNAHKVRATSNVKKEIKLKEADLLFARKGTIGITCIVTPNLKDAIISTELIKVRLKEANPYYAAVFFNSKYGRKQILRISSGAVNPVITRDLFKSLFVPTPPPTFQQKIESRVKEAYKKRKSADEKYKSAEVLLNKVLGIEKLELKDEKVFETKFDEVESTLRFDAEHYQPRYEQVKKFITESGYEVKKLREIVEISNDKIDPSSQPTELFNYIELANVNPLTGEIEEINQIKRHDAPSRARMVVKSGDVLVSSLLGSLDNIGLVPEELDGAVASTGFFVIRSGSFLPEFLFLLFKSNLMKLQLEEKTAGAIMSAVPKTTFGDLLVPVIPETDQKQISNLVKQSFSLRKEAKELLEQAKKEVEEFIEKNDN